MDGGDLLFLTASSCPVILATLSPTVSNTLFALWRMFEVVVVVEPAPLDGMEAFEVTCSLSVMSQIS